MQPAENRAINDDAQRQRDERLSTADLAKHNEESTREQMRAVDKRTEGSNITRLPQRDTERTQLFGPDDSKNLHSRWDGIQGEFVDDPRHAVENADHLVAEAIQILATQFADERGRLEQQWQRSGDVSTEDLRLALQKYRSFFERLLAA